MKHPFFCFFLAAILAAIPSVPVLAEETAQTAWIRKGPQVDKPKSAEVSATENSISSSNDKGTNIITWSVPPAVLHEDDTVTLTMDATSNQEAPPMRGSWYLEDVTNSENVIKFNNDVGSSPTYKRESPHHADMIFKFKPRFVPTIAASAGRYDDAYGNMNGKVTWTYEQGPVPASPVPVATPSPSPEAGPAKISVEVSNVSAKLKPGETIDGQIRVTLSDVAGGSKKSITVKPVLTDYTAFDAAADFEAKDPMSFLIDQNLQSNSRVKLIGANKWLQDKENGSYEFDMARDFPMTIPANLQQGQYMLMVIGVIVGQPGTASARTGVDIDNDPPRVTLDQPPSVTPPFGQVGDTFNLKLFYRLNGLKEEDRDKVGQMNLRVRSNVTGSNSFGVPERPAPLKADSFRMPLAYAHGEIEITTPKITVPGAYTWHYTLDGVSKAPPLNGEISFSVAPPETPGAPAPIPDGMARISGLGVDGAVEVLTPKGWVLLKDGNYMPLGNNAIRTKFISATVELPSGRKLILKPNTEIGFDNPQGEGTLRRGGIKIYGSAEDRKKGWTVKTFNMSAKEDGTIFSVIYDEARQVSNIEVEEGQVTVTPNNPNFPPITLHAGDRVEVSANQAGKISTGPGTSGAQGGTVFEQRVRNLFNFPQYADDLAFDAFASISLVIARLRLPESCYSNDPYVNNPSWQAHRQWSIEHGRNRSGENVIWKTGGALACLPDGSEEKNRLIADIEQIVMQAEAGSVTRVPDIESTAARQPPPPAAHPAGPVSSNETGGVNITGATYGSNCGAPAGNVSQPAQQACNGKNACDYVVDAKVLGDPVPYCAKDYIISWHCGQSSQTHTLTLPGEAGWPPNTIHVSCPPPREAVTSIAHWKASPGEEGGQPVGANQPAAGNQPSAPSLGNAPYAGPPLGPSPGLPPSPPLGESGQPVGANQPAASSQHSAPPLNNAPNAGPPPGPSPGMPPSPLIPVPGAQPDFNSPEAQMQRRNQYMQSAGANSTETNMNSLTLTVSNTFQSTTISDPVIWDFFAAVSLHIARRNLPGSCYGNDPYINDPRWDAHRAVAAQNSRDFLRQRLVPTINAAMRCLSKPAQDNLYADIAEAMAQAWNGQVLRVPDRQ